MVKKNEKLRKVAFIVSILAVVSISVFLIGKSFAFFNYRKDGETVNVVTFKGLNVNILNSSDNALNLSGTYPIYDSEGLNGIPFEFEISSVSSQNIDYVLKIENDADKQNNCMVDGAVCPKLSTNYIKYAYKIGDGEYSTPTNLGENNDIVFSNTINGGSTVRVSLLIWIDQDAPNDAQGKYFFGKVILEANKSGSSYAIAMEGTNVTFSSNSLTTHYGSTEEVTITPAAGSYINGGSCTNGYKITGLTTGLSAITPQTITINNNNQVKGSTCTITTSSSGYDVALEGSNITFGANPITVGYGNISTVTVTPASGYYISGATCTNDYTITGLTTGENATETQIVTINNNNQTQSSICTFTTSNSYTIALNGAGLTFDSSSVNVNYGSTTQVMVTPSSGNSIRDASCTNGYTITGLSTGSSATGTQTITINNNNQTTGSICTFIVFDQPGVLKNRILADNAVITTSPTLTTTSESANENGLYQMSVTNSFGGGSGTTYFFRGDVANNVVEFGNWNSDLYKGCNLNGQCSLFNTLTACQNDSYYNDTCTKVYGTGDSMIWRIVRINEDGTVRLILDTSTGSKSSFNSNRDNYSYMYYSNSNIKNTINTWYSENITGTNASKVASGNYFCEAAKVKAASNYASGSATMTVYSSYTPTLNCTKDGNNKQYVSGSVGLMSYDEVVLAGGYNDIKNTSYYLSKTASGVDNNYTWWTMSPAGFYNWNGSADANAWMVSTFEILTHNSVRTGDSSFRPVINLKSTVTVSKNLNTGHYVVE